MYMHPNVLLNIFRSLDPYDFYRPQRSCGNVMFLHLSVILFTEGGTSPNPPRIHPLGRHPSWADTPPPRPADGHCSGQYVSYWNAPPGRHPPPQQTATAVDGAYLLECILVINDFLHLQVPPFPE